MTPISFTNPNSCWFAPWACQSTFIGSYEPTAYRQPSRNFTYDNYYVYDDYHYNNDYYAYGDNNFPISEQQPPDPPPQYMLLSWCSSVRWYILGENRQPLGPYSIATLHELHSRGYWLDNTLVWAQGCRDWQPISSVLGFSTVPENHAAERELEFMAEVGGDEVIASDDGVSILATEEAGVNRVVYAERGVVVAADELLAHEEGDEFVAEAEAEMTPDVVIVPAIDATLETDVTASVPQADVAEQSPLKTPASGATTPKDKDKALTGDRLKLRERDDAIDLVHKLVRKQSRLSVTDFMKLLSAMVKEQQYSVALSLFEEMFMRTSPVDRYTLFDKSISPDVSGVILAGSADFKTALSHSVMFDPRLQAKILKVVDVSYGGENGFTQAIELSAEILPHVKFIQAKRLIEQFFEGFSQDTGKYVFGMDDTINALGMGADPATHDAVVDLSKLAFERGRADNVSVIVVDLNARNIFMSKVPSPRNLENSAMIRVAVQRNLLSRLKSLSRKPIELRRHLSRFPLLLVGALNIRDWIPWLDLLDLQGYVMRMRIQAGHRKMDIIRASVIDDHLAKRVGGDDKDGYDNDDFVGFWLKKASLSTHFVQMA